MSTYTSADSSPRSSFEILSEKSELHAVGSPHTFLAYKQSLREDASDPLGPIRLAAGDSSLHIAVFWEDEKDVSNVLQQTSTPDVAQTSTPDVDQTNSKGRTALHYAAGIGNIKAAKLLLERGADKCARDSYGATPFHLAARNGDTTLLDMLQVGDINDRAGAAGLTALHYAAWNGKNEAIKWLLAHGASTRVVDVVQGDTPLHSAMRRGNDKAVESLILRGDVDVHQTNKKQQWAIALAGEHRHLDSAKAFVRALTVAKVGAEHTSTWVDKEQPSDGATMLHFFAAYGTVQDLEWFLKLIVKKLDSTPGLKDSAPQEFRSSLEVRDNKGRYAVHWAAMKGNIDIVKFLAENKLVNVNMQNDLFADETPLSLAVWSRQMEFAEELLKWQPDDEDWLGSIKNWMRTYYNQTAKAQTSFKMKLLSLQDKFDDLMHTRNIDKMSIREPSDRHRFFHEMPLMFLALYLERDDIADFMAVHKKGVKDIANETGEKNGRTALHWATLLQQTKIVSSLCCRDEVVANAEDMFGKTALQYAKEMRFSDIENKLMQRKEVSVHVEGMYKDRQLYVDATNAILVGAALIASVTFAGWLQPPLNYTSYYNLPQLPPPSPPDVFQSYASIQHIGVRVFWIFNSLSFCFAIATMIAGLVGVVPCRRMYISSSVKHLHHCLVLASGLLAVSIGFVLGAFAAAGFAVLPPIFKYQLYMMVTFVVGGMPCLALLLWFASRLWSFRPEWYRIYQAMLKRTDESMLDQSQSGSEADGFYSGVISEKGTLRSS
eukprot:c23831_g4_i1 orf=1917-4238(-)